MAQQLSCCALCKILSWLNHQNYMKGIDISVRFQLWAHELWVKWIWQEVGESWGNCRYHSIWLASRADRVLWIDHDMWRYWASMFSLQAPCHSGHYNVKVLTSGMFENLKYVQKIGYLYVTWRSSFSVGEAIKLKLKKLYWELLHERYIFVEKNMNRFYVIYLYYGENL